MIDHTVSDTSLQDNLVYHNTRAIFMLFMRSQLGWGTLKTEQCLPCSLHKVSLDKMLDSTKMYIKVHCLHWQIHILSLKVSASLLFKYLTLHKHLWYQEAQLILELCWWIVSWCSPWSSRIYCFKRVPQVKMARNTHSDVSCTVILYLEIKL